VAIIEIIVMITVAFFIGYGVAWTLRGAPLEQMTDELRNAKYEIRDLEATSDAQNETIENLKRQANQVKQNAANAQLSSDQLNSQISDLTSERDQLLRKSGELEAKLQQLDGDYSSTRFRMKIVESDLDDKTKLIIKLKQELDEVDSSKPTPPEHRD